MIGPPKFDLEATHKFFSANCFNKTWNFIKMAKRTTEDDEKMILMSHASVWHWTQRSDCTARNMSISYWQLARVYVLAGQANNARRYAEKCLEVTPVDDAFCLGYAHEALARAESVAGSSDLAKRHVAIAKKHLDAIENADDKKLLDNDLKDLE